MRSQFAALAYLFCRKKFLIILKNQYEWKQRLTGTAASTEELVILIWPTREQFAFNWNFWKKGKIIRLTLSFKQVEIIPFLVQTHFRIEANIQIIFKFPLKKEIMITLLVCPLTLSSEYVLEQGKDALIRREKPAVCST